MIIYPKDYFKRVTGITYEYLVQHNIKGLILDVDNTLIDYDKHLPTDIEKWVADLKKKGIQLFIVSNTNKKEKVERVAKQLGLEYIFFAQKPSKKGLKKAQKKLDMPKEEIAVIGDQIFTDVIGGNRMKMYSILVEPLSKKDIWITLIKRPIEKCVKKLYFRRRRNHNVPS